jgi:hypothetical protein
LLYEAPRGVVITDETLARRADDQLARFVSRMATAGNPGSARHSVGVRKTRGWVLRFDPVTASTNGVAVIGTDGYVHVPPRPGHRRGAKLTASQWLFGVRSPIEPTYRTVEFGRELDELLAAHING